MPDKFLKLNRSEMQCLIASLNPCPTLLPNLPLQAASTAQFTHLHPTFRLVRVNGDLGVLVFLSYPHSIQKQIFLDSPVQLSLLFFCCCFFLLQVWETKGCLNVKHLNVVSVRVHSLFWQYNFLTNIGGALDLFLCWNSSLGFSCSPTFIFNLLIY